MNWSAFAAEFNGNPAVEFVDTFLYGFWGEGHTWPFVNIPFPDYQTAEKTWVKMLEVQQEHFAKTPLMTNTQPDYSRVGNSEVLDRTIRSYNWIRSDTISIKNEQIETLSNRPPRIAAALEQGIPAKSPDSFPLEEGLSPAENMIARVIDVGANYWSLWNFHAISAKNLMGYYQAFPKWFDQINRRIGYRLRPSMIWSDEDGGSVGLIIGFANGWHRWCPRLQASGMFFLGVISVKFPVLFNVICVPFSRLGQSKTSFYGDDREWLESRQLNFTVAHHSTCRRRVTVVSSTCAVAAYGTDAKTPITDLIIDGNEVHQLKKGSSESL